jgi:hypothetical protein
MSQQGFLLLDHLDVIRFLLSTNVSPIMLGNPEHKYERTFHFSISSCLLLYCLTRSSNTLPSPSELVFRAGMTSSTVRSMRTPLIIRKHFRSPERGVRVSRTSLRRCKLMYQRKDRTTAGLNVKDQVKYEIKADNGLVVPSKSRERENRTDINRNH